MLAVVIVFAWSGISAHAQSSGSFLAGGWSSCEELKQACRDSSADDIYYYGGNLGTMGGHPILGTCYAHDNHYPPGTTYPYACPNYVKLSYNSGQKGYDGGTGCVASQIQAAMILKQLCESGACCCPQVTPKACSVGTPVKARDPITGSCCTFPNPCSAPTDWQAVAPNDPVCS
jgi:hypothetical protein